MRGDPHNRAQVATMRKEVQRTTAMCAEGPNKPSRFEQQTMATGPCVYLLYNSKQVLVASPMGVLDSSWRCYDRCFVRAGAFKAGV